MTEPITFDKNDIEFHAARIRRLAKYMGHEEVLPSDDRTIVGCEHIDKQDK